MIGVYPLVLVESTGVYYLHVCDGASDATSDYTITSTASSGTTWVSFPRISEEPPAGLDWSDWTDWICFPDPGELKEQTSSGPIRVGRVGARLRYPVGEDNRQGVDSREVMRMMGPMRD